MECAFDALDDKRASLIADGALLGLCVPAVTAQEKQPTRKSVDRHWRVVAIQPCFELRRSLEADAMSLDAVLTLFLGESAHAANQFVEACAVLRFDAKVEINAPFLITDAAGALNLFRF